ncbi:MAG: ACS family glucarate transporter-like MFS transporter [Planctomycetaceae bacterium]|jgi:ACS family glucarate transporter-like MFS transporter
MAEAATQVRATRIRYLIVAAATLMSFLLYLDRFCVSFAVDYIRQDLGMSQGQVKWFLSAFFWSYALAQVPSGWLSDRYGARIMLVIYILTWSFFTGLIGAANSFAMLIVSRLGLGLGQAGAYPTAASIVGRWMPVTARGSASAIVANGGRIGGALAPVLTAYLIVQFVPMGTPVELAPKDVLIPSEVIERLQDDGKASSLRAHLTQADAEKLDAATFTVEGSGDDETREYSGVETEDLVAMLNRIIESDEIYNEQQMGTVKLPKEGLAMLALVNEGEGLSRDQRVRFHRFLLEGVFPRGLAKLYGKGWRPIMYIYGFAGIFVGVFFWIFFHNRPEVHPWSNKAEHSLILKGREEVANQDRQKLEPAPILALVKSFNMWCSCFSQWGTNVGWVFLVTWLSRYLLDVHNVPILERGTMAMTPVLIGMLGMMSGGTVTDVLASKVGIKWARRIPIAGSRLVALLAYLCCIGITTQLPADSAFNTPWVFVGLFSVVAFSTDFGTPSSWAFTQDIGGRQVGSVLGWGNMWGNLGAAVSPLIYDYFLGENPTLRDWNMMFAVCAGAFFVSGVFGLLMDATKPLLNDDTESEPASPQTTA